MSIFYVFYFNIIVYGLKVITAHTSRYIMLNINLVQPVPVNTLVTVTIIYFIKLFYINKITCITFK